MHDYATPGSLTRHFKRMHVNRPWPAKGVECNVCGSALLQQKSDLVEHAEAAHGLAWFALISARTFYSYTSSSDEVE